MVMEYVSRLSEENKGPNCWNFYWNNLRKRIPVKYLREELATIFYLQTLGKF